MAAKSRYPQIPSTVWWGLRKLLQKSPNAVIDSRYLSADLGVQEAAANAYVSELKAAGLLTEEGKASPLALKWRIDSTYASAKDEIVESLYPESLRQIAMQSPGDRQKLSNWFMTEGLGQGAANNKASSFLLINTEEPRDGSVPKARAVSESRKNAPSNTIRVKPSSHVVPVKAKKDLAQQQSERFPLNVNLQIHISADAGREQIDAIFSAMKRYLNDSQDN